MEDGLRYSAFTRAVCEQQPLDIGSTRPSPCQRLFEHLARSSGKYAEMKREDQDMFRESTHCNSRVGTD